MTSSKNFWVVARVICLLAFTSVVMALSPAAANAQRGGPQGKGKPGTGTSIVLIKLGNLKTIGCSSTNAYSIRATGSPLVVGMANGCGNPSMVPFIWSADTGIANTGNSPGIWARAVSDNGVIVGLGPDQQPAQFDMLGTPTKILSLPGFRWGEATGITNDGRFIVGQGNNLNSDYHAVVWDHGSDPGLSKPGLDIGVGFPRAVASVGGKVLVVGTAEGHAVIWTGGSANWSRDNLPDGSSVSSDAYDINASGTVIAGIRTRKLASNPSILYDEHVVWVANSSGGWDVVTLKGADPNFNEGLANAVADQVDGSTLVVGFSWEDTPGPGGTQWPVVWRRAAGKTEFQPPVLLPQLSNTGGANAADVNSLGVVVGTSSTSISGYAVMWKLQ